ncbi:hypothetical protein Tco_1001322 [Tanacetum coccineum]
MSESAKRHEENSNMIKEIRASTDAAVRNQGALIKTLEIQIGKISKVLQERGFGSLPSSTEPNPRDHVKSISTTVEADANPIRHIGSSQYAVTTPQTNGSYRPHFSEAYSYEASHINNSIPRKEKDPRSFTLPCYINNACFDNALADLGASVSVIPLSIDPLYGDYIELNDLNVPLEIMRDQVDDLMPAIEECKVIEEVITRNDDLDTGTKDYPNFVVLEGMDAYRDEGMGDVIFGEPFLREIRINAKRFDRMITIYNGNDEVNEEDKMNEISHSYQKLKGFYKGVLNLGPCGPRCKEIDKVDEVSIIWNPVCVVVMLVSRRIYNTHPCSLNLHGESTEQNIK